MSFNFESFVAPPDFGVAEADAPDVRNPRSNEFVRVNPEWVSPEVVVVKVGSKYYLVDPSLCPRVRGHAFKARLAATTASEPGTYFLWPLKDNESMVAAAEKAKVEWTRVVWENSSKAYREEAATEDILDPTWPFASFEEMAEKAFGDRTISDPEDAILKKILGETAKAEA